MRLIVGTALALFVVVIAGCGGGSTTAPDLGFRVEPVGTPPTTAVVGTPVQVSARVLHKETGGGTTPASGKIVTLAVTAGGGTINGVTSATVTTSADGSATATWLLGPTVGTQTVRASVSASEFLDFSLAATAPPASQLALAIQPSASAQSGAALAQQPRVQLKDGSGGNVAQAGVPVTATIETGGGTLAGTQSVATDASGVAAFTDLAITGVIGNRTLRFSATLSGVAVGVTSAAISLAAGAASQLVLATGPSPAAQSGVALAQQPSVQLKDVSGNNVPQAGVQVAAVIETGGGTLTGTQPVSTNANGVAAFANLAISGLIGNRTLKFSATLGGGPANVTSAAIVLAAGPAAQLALTTQPSASAAIGFTLATQPAVQLRDEAGNPVSQAGVTLTASVDPAPALRGGLARAAGVPGAGTLAGGLIATTDGTGTGTFTDLRFIGNTGTTTLTFGATLGEQPRTVNSGPIVVAPPSNGKIVFKSRDDELWTVNPDGSSLTQLTPGTGTSTCSAGDEEPEWSPDGTKLVFTRTENGSQDIWVMNADGSNQTRLTTRGSSDCDEKTLGENPSWSPDGKKILFTSDQSIAAFEEDLWIMNADGTGQTKLFGVEGKSESEARFSPDGRTIAFVLGPIVLVGNACGGGEEEGQEMWLINADGTNPRRVTPLTGCSFDENLAWSPDGQRLVYTRGGSGAALACNDEVFIIDASGTNRTQLTSCLGNSGSEHPAFSPNGTKIVFANGSGGDTIWIMNANGGAPVAINLGALVDNGMPAWQPVRP